MRRGVRFAEGMSRYRTLLSLGGVVVYGRPGVTDRHWSYPSPTTIAASDADLSEPSIAVTSSPAANSAVSNAPLVCDGSTRTHRSLQRLRGGCYDGDGVVLLHFRRHAARRASSAGQDARLPSVSHHRRLPA